MTSSQPSKLPTTPTCCTKCAEQFAKGLCYCGQPVKMLYAKCVWQSTHFVPCCTVCADARLRWDTHFRWSYVNHDKGLGSDCQTHPDDFYTYRANLLKYTREELNLYFDWFFSAKIPLPDHLPPLPYD